VFSLATRRADQWKRLSLWTKALARRQKPTRPHDSSPPRAARKG
jgi:hypothetical protein